MDGKLEFAFLFTDEYLEGHVVGPDQMIMNKLRAGGAESGSAFDLHGLNAVQAWPCGVSPRGCWYKGSHCAGGAWRGRNSPDGMGVLREKLQSWLTQDPFKRVVLAFCTAQSHDGGPAVFCAAAHGKRPDLLGAQRCRRGFAIGLLTLSSLPARCMRQLLSEGLQTLKWISKRTYFSDAVCSGNGDPLQ